MSPLKQLALFILVLGGKVLAQSGKDSLALPFAISNEKKIPEEELKNKKEDFYLTGAPDISSDPVNGFGIGGEASFFYNGKHNDPFFAYTPYRARLDLVVFITNREQKEVFLKLDIPYIFNTKWRLRLEGGAEANPNLLYFGIDENTLKGLSYYPNNDSTQTPVMDAKYRDYESQLELSNPNYHKYDKKEAVFNISVEHSFLEGKFRVLLGYEGAWVNFSSFPGNSLIQNDYTSQKILGLNKGFVDIVQAGLIFDSRDLETDPGQGIFAELTNETSLKALGSYYNFNKTFFHFNYYNKIFPRSFKKLVLAARMAFGYTAFDSPFFEYQDQWSSEGSIEGLGGGSTLRGYKQFRFLSRAMSFNNLELRWRFAETDFLKQHLAFGAVPFVDAGGVWDSFSRVLHFENYRVSEGLGLRIAWNINTILRFDYALSNEDAQFFFNLSHAF